MKRSLQIVTPFLTAAALTLLNACHEPEMQRCVDQEAAAKYPQYVFYYGGNPQAMVGTQVGDGTFNSFRDTLIDSLLLLGTDSVAQRSLCSFLPWLVA